MTDVGYDANDLAVFIRDNSSLSGDEIRERVSDIQSKYEGLVNLEAACFLLAREEGVDLSKHLDLQQELDLDVENLVKDMDSVDIEFKVEKVFSVNEFEDGRVRNVKVFDETGETHMVVWDEDCEVFDYVGPGDVLRVCNGYTKYSDYNSQVEVHIGRDGKVIDVDSAEELIE